MGENIRIVRLASLDSGRGCEREALSDKEGEGTRCQETKHSLGENVRVLRVAAIKLLMAAVVATANAAEEKPFETMRGRGRDVKRRNILWMRM